MSKDEPTDACATWRDGWVAGQVEGACTTARAYLEHPTPHDAALAVLDSLHHRFGARALSVGAYQDLFGRVVDDRCASALALLEQHGADAALAALRELEVRLGPKVPTRRSYRDAQTQIRGVE